MYVLLAIVPFVANAFPQFARYVQLVICKFEVLFWHCYIYCICICYAFFDIDCLTLQYLSYLYILLCIFRHWLLDIAISIVSVFAMHFLHGYMNKYVLFNVWIIICWNIYLFFLEICLEIGWFRFCSCSQIYVNWRSRASSSFYDNFFMNAPIFLQF